MGSDVDARGGIRYVTKSIVSTAFSERIVPCELNARRKKRRRDARKRTMSALGVRGTACQREMSAFQRSDGINPPYEIELAPLTVYIVHEMVQASVPRGIFDWRDVVATLAAGRAATSSHRPVRKRVETR